MPVKCPFCETNTHGDHDKDEYPDCIRKFLTKNEAWAIIGEFEIKGEYHVFLNPKEDVLLGANWSRNAIKTLIEDSDWIELCDTDGVARKLNHGLCLHVKNHLKGVNYFIETPEKALIEFEELYETNTI